MTEITSPQGEDQNFTATHGKHDHQIDEQKKESTEELKNNSKVEHVPKVWGKDSVWY